MSQKALILNYVEDLIHCYQEGLHQQYRLYTTHPSVKVYAKDILDLECKCISEFVEIKDVLAVREASIDEVPSLLDQMNQQIEEFLFKLIDQPINYFRSSYLYVCVYEYVGIWYLKRFIKEIQQRENIKTVRFYRTKLINFIMERDYADYFCDELGLSYEKTIFHNIQLPKKSRVDQFSNLIKKFLFFPEEAFEELKQLNSKKIEDNPKLPTMYFKRGFYDFAKVEKELRESFNLKLFEGNEYLQKEIFESIKLPKIDIDQINYHTDLKKEGRILARLLAEDFKNSGVKYLSSLIHFAREHHQLKGQVALWGNPPVRKINCLIFDYLKCCGVQRIGYQHGNIPGFVKLKKNLYSDFMMVDHYISYGFDKDDYQICYDQSPKDFELHSFGKLNIPDNEPNRIQIDVLFPISNSLFMLDSGWDRHLPHDFSEYQRKIINFLENSTYSAVLKPPKNYHENVYAFSHLHRTFKHLKMVDYCNLNHFLKKYEPKVIIVDANSTPLFDAMMTTAEVFYLENPFTEIHAKARPLFDRRVHSFHSVDELLKGIDLFFEGKLESRQDQAFLEHYIMKDRTKENVLALIRDIVQRKDHEPALQ